MSKKKAAGSTMTLKDFHGGSIPSDLPLPSAPGVTLRPSDRPGFDRPASWSNPSGRGDPRSRLGSSAGTRPFDDKTPFLTPIGRNFEEDERKPLDGVSVPRRMISDDSIRASSGRLELKPQQFSGERPLGQQGHGGNVLPLPSQISYSGRVSGATQGSVGSQNVYGSSGQGVSGSVPNAWAAKKEPLRVVETAQPAWAAPSASSKLIHASALDKVSSGRWQSRQSTMHEADVESVKHAGEPVLNSKSYDDAKYSRTESVGARGYIDGALSQQVERNLTIGEGYHGPRRVISDGEMREDSRNSNEKSRNVVPHGEAFQPMHSEGRIAGPDIQRPLSAEAADRPRLKLLPRTKPLDNPELPSPNHKEWLESAHSENINGQGIETGSQTIERPKLNLKPRSQPRERLEGPADQERSSVFGGARPRELVLKERGVDDVNVDDYDAVQTSERTKQVVTKNDRVPGSVTSTRYGEKPEKLSLDQRNGRRLERKDQQAEDRNDAQRNWRNDNRRIVKDNMDKQQQAPRKQQERRPSPEIWRKPVEEPKPSSPEPGVRFGKAASAAELAQAFARPFSASKTPEQLRATQGQIPFSRLTAGQAPRPQINGY